MAFDGTEGRSISLSAASDLTAEYRSEYPNDIKAHFVGKDIINDILDQTGCMGLRIYHGIDTSGNRKVVIVGADGSEDDMLDLIADFSVPCPAFCGSSNDLNS